MMILSKSNSACSKPTIEEFIELDLLISWGASFKKIKAGEIIFKEDEHAHFYQQLLEGKVKMYNFQNDGKEFIQGFFGPGDSFGEAPIFTESTYPASAIAVTNVVVVRLASHLFMELLQSNPTLHMQVSTMLAKRLLSKSLTLKNMSGTSPSEKILGILSRIKNESGKQQEEKIKIDFTRQELAAMSGLRVETVIRIMRKMFENKLLQIDRGKVFF